MTSVLGFGSFVRHKMIDQINKRVLLQAIVVKMTTWSKFKPSSMIESLNEIVDMRLKSLASFLKKMCPWGGGGMGGVPLCACEEIVR